LHHPSSKHAEKGSRQGRLILRLAFGAGLVGVSLWGIRVCRELFGLPMVPGDSAIDRSSQGLAAGAAWFVFFAPVAVAGVALLWSALRRTGAFAAAAEWFAERMERGRSGSVHGKREGASAGHTEADPHGLESLSAPEVTRLDRLARRIVVLLGSTVGSLLVGVGIFGLGYLWLFSGPYGSAVSGTLSAARIAIEFAILSGVSIVVGLVVLRQTFTGENGSWLVPLRVFTNLVLARWWKEQRMQEKKARTPEDRQIR
jgi:hypothetical protein